MRWSLFVQVIFVAINIIIADSGYAGCTKDTDCKGDRICENGRCVNPQSVRKVESKEEQPVKKIRSRFVDNGNDTVIDTETGLTWEKQDSNRTYSWEAANAYCADLSLAGTGWRMPTREEVQTLLNRSHRPTIDPVFKASNYLVPVWTVTSNANAINAAWNYGLVNASFDNSPKSAGYHVRCVKSRMTSNGSNFSDNGNGTVTDTATGLTWEKQDSDRPYTWEVANAYCSDLSLAGAGWRMPTREEVKTLFNRSRRPTIDPAFRASNYLVPVWTVTSNANTINDAWNYGLVNASFDNSSKSAGYHVRCVR